MNPRRKQKLISFGIGLLVGAALPVAYFLPTQLSLRERLTAERDAHAELRKETDAERLALQGKIADAERHTRQAEAMTATLRAQVKEMGDALLDVRNGIGPARGPAGGAEGGTRPRTPAGRTSTLRGFPRYKYAALNPALEKVDWKAVGESYAGLPPLLARIADLVAEGTPSNRLPRPALQQIQQYNRVLHTASTTLTRGGVPTSTQQSALIHPAVIANSLAAALLVVKRPIGASQSTEIGRLVGVYAKQDEARREQFDSATQTQLAGLVSEAASRRAFLGALFGQLSDEQLAALRQSEVAVGRLQLDPFSEGQIWLGAIHVIEFKRKSDLQAKVGAWLMRTAAIPAEQLAQTRAIVDQWVAGLPDEFVDEKADAFTRIGMLPGDHVSDSARRVSELVNALLERLDLPDDAAGRLRAMAQTCVPVAY